MNTVQNLMPDEVTVLDQYRRAKAMRFATLEISIRIHDQELAQLDFNFTEKFRPKANGLVKTKE